MKVTRSAARSVKAVKPVARSSVGRLLRAFLAIIIGFLVLMVLVVLSNPSGLQRGIAKLEQRWGATLYSFDRPLTEKLSIVIGSFLRDINKDVPDIPELVIDVPFKGMQKIYAKREAALQQAT
jgi:hypothetical protein